MSKSNTLEDIYNQTEELEPDFIYILDENGNLITNEDDEEKIKRIFALKKKNGGYKVTEWENVNGNYKKSEIKEEIKSKNGKYDSSDTSLKTVLTELNKVAPPKKKDFEPKLQKTKPLLPSLEPEPEPDPETEPKVKENASLKLEKTLKGGRKNKSKKRRKGGSDHKGKKPMNLTYPLPRTRKEIVDKVTEVVDLGEKAEAITGKRPKKEGKAKELSLDEFGVVNRGELHANSPEVMEMGEKVIEDSHARGDLDTAIRMGTMHLGTLESQGIEREHPEFKKAKSALVDYAVERNQKRKEAARKKKAGGRKTRKTKLRSRRSKSSRATRRV